MQIHNTSKKLLTVIGFCAIVVILLGINFTSSNFLNFVRLDLTSDKIFTLSNGSKKVLTNLEEPITLKLFFSKQLAKDNPYFLSFASRVEEFLKLYKHHANGKINLQIIDPVPFTEYEDQAVHYGLQGVPVNNEGSELYFGLVMVNSVAGKEVIPFLQPNREGYLEYDITQAIFKLSNRDSNKIAVISSLPIQGDPGFQFAPQAARPWVIWQQIQQQFDAKLLTAGSDQPITKIPSDTKVLLLITSGEELPSKTAEAIDQFTIEGGKVLLLLDPISEIEQPKANNTDAVADSATTISINKLLTAWGVDYDSSKVIASRKLAKQVRYNQEGKETTTLYPLWIDLDQSAFAKEDILTANLNKLTFAAAGSITPSLNNTSQFSPLVKLTSDVMLVDTEQVAKYRSNPQQLLRDYQPQDQAVTLAARITGQIRSAFNDKIAKNANIVVVANADFMHDHFWVTAQNFLGNQIIMPNSGNGDFILNALDNLTGSEALISVRNKNSYTRGFDKIKEIELQSQNRFQQAEVALLKRIEDTKSKLANRDQNKLSAEYKQEEAAFRQDLIETRKQLREVRRSLREDIQVLENKIKFFTVLFIPLLIILSFLVSWLLGVKFFNVFKFTKRD
jgi:ABC-type uncharacterized transport system involved in gliding motility auxiliary subunit